MMHDGAQGMAFPWEQAQMGLQRQSSRTVKQNLQQACAERLAEILGESDLSPICFEIDKIFCSAWLDHNNVLVGTKCNKLRKVHIPTRTWQDIPYPAQPMHRDNPDLLASSNRAHCGQHDFAVSPSGACLVTGGTAAEDIILWRLQDSPSSTSSSASSSSASGMGMQPVQTLMGHADWVFGLDWLSDRHWVSGSRDGTIKLWQVPDPSAQDGSSGTYTADPGSALLSVGYHAGKVRAVSFDHQQQHVVALATDDTISWWTPDLQLKCGARLMDCSDPVALTTGGNIVAVGSFNRVHLLDTREPNAGLKRNSNSLSGSKRSRSPFSSSAAAASGMGLGHPAPAVALSPADLFSLQQLHSQLRWLPSAYGVPRPVRPTVLAVTGNMPGMQRLQKTSAAVGMDPLMAEQLLRQEAATLAVSQGKHFDAALEGLLSRLVRLRPSQQLQELTALLQKSNQSLASTLQQQRQQEEQQQQQHLEYQETWLQTVMQHRQQQHAEMQRQTATGELRVLGAATGAARDGEGGPGPGLADAGPELAEAEPGADTDPGSPQVQQQQQQQSIEQQQQQQEEVPQFADSEADPEDPDQFSEVFSEEYTDGEQDYDEYGDLYAQDGFEVGSGRYGLSGQLDALRQLGPYPLHAPLPSGVNSPGMAPLPAMGFPGFLVGAGTGGLGGMGGMLGAPPADLPDPLRYIYERVQPNSHLAMNGHVQQMRLLQQQQGQLLQGQQGLYQEQGSWQPSWQPPVRRAPAPHVFSARQAGKLMLNNSVVRSVSIHSEHILGVGHTSMEFYDLRKISGSHVSTAPTRPDSSLLLRQVEVRSVRMGLDPALVRHGYDANFEMNSTVYSHCWDPSGTRVLAAGGALSLGCRGALLHLLM